MSIHVNELHTDIRPASDGQHTEPGGARPTGVSADDTWRESRGRRHWIEARTSADGYED